MLRRPDQFCNRNVAFCSEAARNKRPRVCRAAQVESQNAEHDMNMLKSLHQHRVHADRDPTRRFP